MILSESQIEKKLTERIQKKGGLCFKFTSPGNPGVPDRIVITPTGRVVFIELKSEKGRLSGSQRFQLRRIKNCKAEARVLIGEQGVIDFINEVFSV